MDPLVYQSELIGISNHRGQTGYGEIISSEKLAEELACLHLALLENNFDFKLPHEQIPIAAMLELIDIAEAQSLVAQGFQTLKFKVGKNWEWEAESLSELRQKIGPQIDIRLDANRAFNLQNSIQFGKRIAGLRISYFEEPLQDYKKIPNFVQATGIPVALDETLIEGAPVLEGVSTYAIKPFLMPSLHKIFECIDLAREREIDVAICSAFESPYSLNWLVLLAALSQTKPLAAGLSTYRWFEGELIKPVFLVQAALDLLLNCPSPKHLKLSGSSFARVLNGLRDEINEMGSPCNSIETGETFM